MSLSAEQSVAKQEIKRFLRDPTRQTFVLEGDAGTGKSFLMADLAREMPHAQMMAYTGKAASVLSRRTGMTATTIHSAIYQFTGKDEEDKPRFGRRIDPGEWEGNIALVDEHRTVGTRLGRDLIATGCKVIACGDPNQLMPVGDTPYFDTVDARLEEVRRQAWDSPIIRQAHKIKNTGRYEPDGDNFRVTSHISADDIMAADVILCWRNATRRALNQLVRQHRGFGMVMPRAGEPVMCLQNKHELGLLNGATYELLEDHDGGSGRIVVRGERGNILRLRQAWIEDLDPPILTEHAIPFTMAYAATVHKFQGSECNSLILVDEYNRSDERWNWLYTGVTRAIERVTVKV